MLTTMAMLNKLEGLCRKVQLATSSVQLLDEVIEDDAAKHSIMVFDIEHFNPDCRLFLFPNWLATKDNNIVLCRSGFRRVLANEI
ncbi:hypothetical protein A0J61_09887 [Choanephora cucurbitarum]|uniref:Uncharacterized protein n=1 Tax=Choanephora cucurbitarum TaxID=101091 RepID=A0A1C7MYR4_9FUNG|nr:hypothetical protein A0J61_09887 [Choanephora cucurbitarum]